MAVLGHKIVLGSLYAVVSIFMLGIYCYRESLVNTSTRDFGYRNPLDLPKGDTPQASDRYEVEYRQSFQLGSGRRNQSKKDNQYGRRGGYILAISYYEQQTMATGNLLELQCFASKLNLSVVEPLVKESSFFSPFFTSDSDPVMSSDSMLKMDSIYNMSEWRKYTKRNGYAPLVSSDDFLKNAPRDVILVQMKHPTQNFIKQAKKNGVFPHPVTASRDYERGCGFKVINKTIPGLKHKKFTVVHHVCYNFITGDSIPIDVYIRELTSRYRNFTIVLDQWRGIAGGDQRVLIRDNICANGHDYRERTKSSATLQRDAAAYVERFLHGEKYLAVIGRYEMTGLTQRIRDESDPHAIIPYCLKLTLNEVKAMKQMTGLKQTFLSVDIGKYGSKSFVRKSYFGHLKDMTSFVEEVYEGKMNLTEWERTFEKVATSLDPGYVAKLQQLIVAKAQCILFVGGGTFQKHTHNMYQEFHPILRDQCISTLAHCTSQNRPFIL